MPIWSEVTEDDEVLLRFHGLDTIADITLNGCRIGSTDNMHRVWDYSVRELLKDTGNELEITFHSPVRFIAKEYAADPAILGTEDAMRGFPKIRKGHYMFGWDWGPRLPDAGIWKSVELLRVHRARLDSVYVHQEFNDDLSAVSLNIHVDLACVNGRCGGSYQPAAAASVLAPDGTALYKGSAIVFDANGSGTQCLRSTGPGSGGPTAWGTSPCIL